MRRPRAWWIAAAVIGGTFVSGIWGLAAPPPPTASSVPAAPQDCGAVGEPTVLTVSDNAYRREFPKGIPDRFLLPHDPWQGEWVGRTASGQAFFVTPAGGMRTSYVVTYLWDSAGNFEKAIIDTMPDFSQCDPAYRPVFDESPYQETLDAHLAALGPVKYKSVMVAPVHLRLDGLDFGFVAQDGYGQPALSHQPSDDMVFYAPWNTGEYDT